jgi:hypothetical protein
MSESTPTMMAESGMPANPYQYWTCIYAHDVPAPAEDREETTVAAIGGMGRRRIRQRRHPGWRDAYSSYQL